MTDPDMTDRERNQWLAAGLAIFLLSVAMALDAMGFDLSIWRL